MKEWFDHDDYILSTLCKSIINRKLPKIEIRKQAFEDDYLEELFKEVEKKHSLGDSQKDYFVFGGEIRNQAYNAEKERINILQKDGEIMDIVKASDDFSMSGLSNSVTKYFICHPKL